MNTDELHAAWAQVMDVLTGTHWVLMPLDEKDRAASRISILNRKRGCMLYFTLEELQDKSITKERILSELADMPPAIAVTIIGTDVIAVARSDGSMEVVVNNEAYSEDGKTMSPMSITFLMALPYLTQEEEFMEQVRLALDRQGYKAVKLN